MGNYIALTKPRIIELLLVTTVPTMIVAEQGVPSLWLMAATVIGGTLAAGGANAINMYVDRDIDALMERTKNRPLVTGLIKPRNGLIFAIGLEIVAFVWLWYWVNLLTAALGVAACLFYVFIYTLLLKLRTSQNVVWGGAAGCMPVMIGWSAVTGTIEWPALVMFAVIFFWTPPHYWPLSMAFKDDYANAHVPMLPVERGAATVARQIVAYSWAMVAASLALIPVANMGWIYVVAAFISGGVFVAEAHRLLRLAKAGAATKVLKPMRLFHFSITYVTLLFLAVAIDPIVHLAIR